MRADHAIRFDAITFYLWRLRGETAAQFTDRVEREALICAHRRAQLQPYTPTRRVEKLEDADDRRC